MSQQLVEPGGVSRAVVSIHCGSILDGIEQFLAQNLGAGVGGQLHGEEACLGCGQVLVRVSAHNGVRAFDFEGHEEVVDGEGEARPGPPRCGWVSEGGG